MKLIFTFVSLIALGSVQAASKEADATYADIKATLGSVPTFLKQFPEASISAAWADMKAIQLNPKTAISGKYKELIGIAVSAQIPCRFCTYFHHKAASLNGATQGEISEAIALAANTRRWSAIFNGSQIPLDQFKQEVDRMMKHSAEMRDKMAEEARTPDAAPEIITTSAQAYEDMKRVFGFVPSFAKNYPEGSIANVWNELKSLEFNPATRIPAKYKDLINLAVSAQTPCAYCVYFDTKSAMHNGATQQEIDEAVAMSGITRHWSTVLNGQYTDEKKFEREADQVMSFVKANAAKKVTSL